MKPWELTTICAPHLKAVLGAAERTQLDFYGIELNLIKIEEALTTFMEKIQQVKEEQQHDFLHHLERCESGDQQPDVT